eukprot:m.161655 g.161655  ORF g.161655 m.161655 type:complete len:1408 (+) comp10289_c0_seq2:78-4301(+)
MMNRFRAFNEPVEDEETQRERLTREAEETELIEKYNSGLEALAEHSTGTARRVFDELIEHPRLKAVAPADPENPSTEPLYQLKTAVLKQQAALFPKNRLRQRIQCLLDALSFNATDAGTWQDLGLVAVEADNIALARFAFEQGLANSPMFWPCLVQLGKLFLMTQDYDQARAIASRLEGCNSAAAKDLAAQIAESSSITNTEAAVSASKRRRIDAPDAPVLKVPVKAPSWEELSAALNSAYIKCMEEKDASSFGSAIHLDIPDGGTSADGELSQALLGLADTADSAASITSKEPGKQDQKRLRRWAKTLPSSENLEKLLLGPLAGWTFAAEPMRIDLTDTDAEGAAPDEPYEVREFAASVNNDNSGVLDATIRLLWRLLEPDCCALRTSNMRKQFLSLYENIEEQINWHDPCGSFTTRGREFEIQLAATELRLLEEDMRALNREHVSNVVAHLLAQETNAPFDLFVRLHFLAALDLSAQAKAKQSSDIAAYKRLGQEARHHYECCLSKLENSPVSRPFAQPITALLIFAKRRYLEFEELFELQKHEELVERFGDVLSDSNRSSESCGMIKKMYSSFRSLKRPRDQLRCIRFLLAALPSKECLESNIFRDLNELLSQFENDALEESDCSDLMQGVCQAIISAHHDVQYSRKCPQVVDLWMAYCQLSYRLISVRRDESAARSALNDALELAHNYIGIIEQCDSSFAAFVLLQAWSKFEQGSDAVGLTARMHQCAYCLTGILVDGESLCTESHDLAHTCHKIHQHQRARGAKRSLHSEQLSRETQLAAAQALFLVFTSANETLSSTVASFFSKDLVPLFAGFDRAKQYVPLQSSTSGYPQITSKIFSLLFQHRADSQKEDMLTIPRISSAKFPAETDPWEVMYIHCRDEMRVFLENELLFNPDRIASWLHLGRFHHREFCSRRRAVQTSRSKLEKLEVVLEAALQCYGRAWQLLQDQPVEIKLKFEVSHSTLLLLCAMLGRAETKTLQVSPDVWKLFPHAELTASSTTAAASDVANAVSTEASLAAPVAGDNDGDVSMTSAEAVVEPTREQMMAWTKAELRCNPFTRQEYEDLAREFSDLYTENKKLRAELKQIQENQRAKKTLASEASTSEAGGAAAMPNKAALFLARHLLKNTEFDTHEWALTYFEARLAQSEDSFGTDLFKQCWKQSEEDEDIESREACIEQLVGHFCDVLLSPSLEDYHDVAFKRLGQVIQSVCRDSELYSDVLSRCMTSYVSRLEHDERSDVTSPFATWALLKHVDILLRLQRHSEAVELTCRLDNIKTLSFPLQYLSKCVLFTLKVLQECMNKADIDTCWELAGRTVRVLETFFNDVYVATGRAIGALCKRGLIVHLLPFAGLWLRGGGVSMFVAGSIASSSSTATPCGSFLGAILLPSASHGLLKHSKPSTSY